MLMLLLVACSPIILYPSSSVFVGKPAPNFSTNGKKFMNVWHANNILAKLNGIQKKESWGYHERSQ
jgi:hypothetical protein